MQLTLYCTLRKISEGRFHIICFLPRWENICSLTAAPLVLCCEEFEGLTWTVKGNAYGQSSSKKMTNMGKRHDYTFRWRNRTDGNHAPENGKKMTAIHMSDKGLESKLYKELLQLNDKKTTQRQTGHKTWRDSFPKKTYIWLVSAWEDAQHRSWRKCKTTMRHHFTPTRMPRINKTGNGKCWQRREGARTPVQCRCVLNAAAARRERRQLDPSQATHGVATWRSNLAPGSTPQGNENTHPHKTYTRNSHGNIICFERKWKRPKYPSIDEQIDKQNVEHPSNGTLVSHPGMKYWFTLQQG